MHANAKDQVKAKKIEWWHGIQHLMVMKSSALQVQDHLFEECSKRSMTDLEIWLAKIQTGR